MHVARADFLIFVPAVRDQALPAQVGRHRRHGLATHSEHQRQKLMRHRELVLRHAVVHLEHPSSCPSLHGMEAFAADDLPADLQDGLRIPVEDRK